MDPNVSELSIRSALDHLKQVLSDTRADQGRAWYDAVDQALGALEFSLGDGDERPARFEYLADLARAHPRLIALCREFQEDGRRLLRQAAIVVHVSLRGQQDGKSQDPVLRTAAQSLVDAVERYLAMEEALSHEAGRELGGEG